MTAPVRASRLWKAFRRGERHDSLRDLVPSLLRRKAPTGDLAQNEFWAVRDVSFEVQRGEALGIIGPNGAGKSTMLKLLNRILRPTRGHLTIAGRSAALIELAAGFHPDLTGRENVFLQGAIMGMRREELTSRLDAIIDFSGIGPFIDTPVKRYSSGMNARLGFSIAAHLEPDVLLIDEVLSVGDMAFQQRCIQRMHEFKRNGCAIVFISHDLQAVSNLCDHALFLKSSVQAYGPVSEVIGRYVVSSAGATGAEGIDVSIEHAKLELEDGSPAGAVAPGEPMQLVARFRVDAARPRAMIGLVMVRSTDGLVVYDGNFAPAEGGADFGQPGHHTIRFRFRPHVTRGLYHFVLHVSDASATGPLTRLEPAASLTVNELRSYAGVADLGVSVSAGDLP